MPQYPLKFHRLIKFVLIFQDYLLNLKLLLQRKTLHIQKHLLFLFQTFFFGFPFQQMILQAYLLTLKFSLLGFFLVLDPVLGLVLYYLFLNFQFFDLDLNLFDLSLMLCLYFLGFDLFPYGHIW